MPETVSPRSIGPTKVDNDVRAVEARLLRDYAGQVGDAVVRRYVRQAHAELRPARVGNYVGVLVEHDARERLRRHANAERTA
jgi:hypothetical protein